MFEDFEGKGGLDRQIKQLVMKLERKTSGGLNVYFLMTY